MVLVIYSCTERIDIKLDDSYTCLVVDGQITSDTVAHCIKLTKTTSYFHNQVALAVSGALVQISNEDSIIVLIENPVNSGIYKTPENYYGEIGKLYSLYIDNVDINNDGTTESYQASDNMNNVNQIDSIDVAYQEDWEGWEVKVWAWEPPSTDFYIFKVYKNGVLLTDSIIEYWVQDDAFFNGNYTNGITSQFLSDNKDNELTEIGDTVIFEINSISEEYYKFILEVQTEIYGSNPLFSGPPANIRTNISNGALGFFSAYSLARAETIVD